MTLHSADIFNKLRATGRDGFRWFSLRLLSVAVDDDDGQTLLIWFSCVCFENFLSFFFSLGSKYSSSRSHLFITILCVRETVGEKKRKFLSVSKFSSMLVDRLCWSLRQSFVSITHKRAYCSRYYLSGQGQFLPSFDWYH